MLFWMELFSLNAIKSAHWALNIALFSLFVTALLHLLLAKSEKSAVEEQDKKGTFPVFKDAEVIRAYWNYKATYKSLGILSFFRLIIYLAFMHSAINLISEHDGSPYFLSCSVALVLIKIGFLFYVLAAAGVAIIGWRDPSGANEQLQCWKSFLVTRLLGGKLEEISVIAMFIWLGLILYARVDASAYPHPPAGSMTCDPSNVSRSLPVDHVLFNAFLVVTSPLGLRGMRFEVAILLWVISVGFLIASMVRVGGNFDWMTASIYVIPLTLLFEHERFMRLSFQSIQLAEQRSEALVKLRTAELERENQKELAARERAQLVALIGNVAHDLKTPLHSFKMDLELLRAALVQQFVTASMAYVSGKADNIPEGRNDTKGGLPSSVESLLRSLSGSSEFMTMAVNRGIEFAKTSGGIQLQATMTSFDLREALAMPLQILESLKSKTSIALRPLPAGIARHVISDLHWLRENVLCLLSNALKYSQDGTSVSVVVEVVRGGELAQEMETENQHQDLQADSNHSTKGETPEGNETAPDAHTTVIPLPSPDQEYLRISVLDRGIGIPEEVRRKLFRPFQQAQRMAGGTGLGLYSLSMRMQALGGYRGVASRPDGLEGSVFWFAFPYKPDTMAESLPGSGYNSGSSTPPMEPVMDTLSSQSPAVSKLSSSSENKFRPRVLIVDDSLSVLKVTERSVKQAGLECETAPNGAVALERMKAALSKGEIDVVMIDFQMPVMDGPTCVSRFREYETEYIRQSQKERSDGAGGDEKGEGNREDDVSRSEPLSNGIEGSGNGDGVRTGAEAGTAVRRSRKGSERVAIVGMSANSDEANRKLGLEAGMDAFIPKPFTMKDLQTTLEQLFYD